MRPQSDNWTQGEKRTTTRTSDVVWKTTNTLFSTVLQPLSAKIQARLAQHQDRGLDADSEAHCQRGLGATSNQTSKIETIQMLDIDSHVGPSMVLAHKKKTPQSFDWKRL